VKKSSSNIAEAAAAAPAFVADGVDCVRNDSIVAVSFRFPLAAAARCAFSRYLWNLALATIREIARWTD